MCKNEEIPYIRATRDLVNLFIDDNSKPYSGLSSKMLIKNADCWAPAQVLPDQISESKISL